LTSSVNNYLLNVARCYCVAGQHLITAIASLKFGFQTTSW